MRSVNERHYDGTPPSAWLSLLGALTLLFIAYLILSHL